MHSISTLERAPQVLTVATTTGVLTVTADAVVLPGLVDLHTHVGGAGFGREIDADRDILSTGTTAGVGIFHEPPEDWLLRPGDVVEVEVEKIGVLSNAVVAG